MDKTLSKLREDARKILDSKKSTPVEKELAQKMLALDSVVVMLESSRNHYLQAFVETNNIDIKEARKTAKKENGFLDGVLKSWRNQK